MKLCFPPEVLKQHLVVLGKTGAGKSSTLRHVVEHLLHHKKRVCVIDIKGDWWGLKSSADGKSAGYPIIAFGSFREPAAADVPINPRSGQHIAELITSGNRPCVIGFRGWMPGEVTDFWLDFAPALFNKNEGELYVVISECHNFAPKGKVLDPKAGKVLHWTNRLLSEGRGLGMTFLLDSQRPQKVHNDTLTCCETLIAMRVTHAADRQAIKDWIDGCGDKATGAEVLNNLAQLARGEAWVWSPEIGFGPKRLQFPMFETFDSFAPAQLQHKVSQVGWSNVDLDAVKEKLAKVIEEAKANDPEALKARIRQLERDMGKMPVGPATVTELVVDHRAVEAAVEKQRAADNEILRGMVRDDQRLRDGLLSIVNIANELRQTSCPVPIGGLQPISIGPIKVNVDQHAPLNTVTFKTTKSYTTAAPSNGHGEKLPPGERAVLIAAAQYAKDGVDRDQLSVLTGYKRSSRDAYIQRLREKGYVMVDGARLLIIEAGIQALGSDYQPLPTGPALQEYWRERLPEGERKVLEILLSAAGASIPREVIDENTGYKRSSRDAYLQRLAARRLVEYAGRGEVKASATLF